MSLLSSSRSSSYSSLLAYGWDDDWAAAFAPYAAQGLLPGRVLRVDRGQCDLVTPEGVVRADTTFVVPHDPLRVICTGDWAAVDPDGVGDPRYVRAYLPRCVGWPWTARACAARPGPTVGRSTYSLPWTSWTPERQPKKSPASSRCWARLPT